ncbi:hypothetical protein [Deinococcus sp. Marseille-Q6407]|uniref:hypothetical protein n=1 Tax=Deinococcus sp. Marseille-Q6407 TaxID=2969223 RepID=UPI0021BFCD12|nr:hypothetical protein [Deinococcus sp. Marseille-Q6407]
MQRRNLKIWGIALAALVAAAWLSLTGWEYGAKTWNFRAAHRVVAVKDVTRDGPSMPFSYRDVYFVTTPESAEADVKACAAAFGHDMTSETQFTRCHAFLSAHSAQLQMQASKAIKCEIAHSEQTPYMDAKTVKVVIERVATCDLG